jgi:hypothetical protein
LVVFAVSIGAAAIAHADPAAPPPGAESLTRGIQALDAHDYKQAEKLFDSALARGGLTRAQTLTSYVDLGVTLVALGRTDAARRAFEEAALIDPRFVVPKKSGAAALRLAERAKKTEDGIGPYHLEASVPEHAAPGAPIRVRVELAQEQADHVGLIRVAASEPGGKSFETIEPSAAHFGVEVPAEVAVAGQTVAIKLELLDAHDNRLASAVELDVAIDATAATGSGGDAGSGTPPPGTGSATVAATGSDNDAAGSDDDAETGPWSIPHGSKKYTAVRADRPPIIDGELDDPAWRSAPTDDRFLSTKSKPFGKPSPLPTVLRVAYDDTNLYVAVHCTYARPHPPSDAYSGDEATVFTESESVAVLVDGVHTHSGAYEFAVSPAGVRADAELSDQGAAQNLDWHGIWDVATAIDADGNGWTAEFQIPWGTLYMPSADDAFDIGLEVERHDPITGETSLWALHPPATELFDVTYFGHVDGLSRVHPGQRLLLLPYGALAFDSAAPGAQSLLTDLTGTDAQGRAYGGIYVRLRPPGPFRLDATFNPDFSAVNPDATLANYDRFELEYPEVRPFFAEDAPRFAFGATRYFFGDLGGQLFYSRRLGILTDTAGLTELVPILSGVKAVLRAGGTEAALMNVETVAPKSGVVLQDNATIGRVTETIDGQRFGAIVLDREGDSGAYSAAGVDSQLALYDRHLELRGFFAGAQSAATGSNTSAAGEGTVSWKSQDVYAKATLLDIGKDFDAPLGFFEITGVRDETIAAGYTPVVRSDLVQQVFLDTQLSVVRDRDSDALVYQRAVIGGSLSTIEGALVSAQVQPSTEVVTTPFPIGNGKITIPAGTYHVLGTQFDLTSPPNRDFVYGIHYQGGQLFEGTRRAPGVMLGVNLGRLAARVSYVLYILKFEDLGQDFLGHDVSVTASYAFTPLARSALVLEADTVAARATAQLTTTYQFGALSALTLSVRGSGGSTIDVPATSAFDNLGLSAILSLAYGVSPF